MFLRSGIVAGLIVGLPWLGARLAGHDLSRLLVFPPPVAIPADYLRFSPWAVLAVVAAIALIVGGWLKPSRSRTPHTTRAVLGVRRCTPRWIFPALVWVAAW